jgi:hypothetical protein
MSVTEHLATPGWRVFAGRKDVRDAYWRVWEMGERGPPCRICVHPQRHIVELGLLHKVPIECWRGASPFIAMRSTVTSEIT